VGVIKKRVKQICRHGDEWIHESTLCWAQEQWIRAAQLYPVHEVDTVFYTFVVAPTATLELESGLMIRDYVEILSPETEAIYADKIASTS
jgi:hypothetical protein